MTLEERIQKLEDEMYSQGFWQRPAPKPREFPTTEATDLTFINEPDGASVVLTFDYKCAICQTEMMHEYLVVRLAAVHQPEPYSKLMSCSKDDEHRTKVIFRRDSGQAAKE